MKHLLYTITLLFVLGFGHMTFGQIQVGQTFMGRNSDSELGSSVAISADGNRMIIGASDDEFFSTTNPGYAKIYDWDGLAWIQVGNTLEGEDYSAFNFGLKVDISHDGNRVLIASKNEFIIFDWDGSTWNQVGNSVNVDVIFGRTSFDLSGDGQSIVYGHADPIQTFLETVEVYELLGNIWTIKGNTIYTPSSGSLFGSSTSINESGDIIAIGAYFASPGTVNVYKWDGLAWISYGNTLTNSYSVSSGFGISVDLDNAGNRLAIAATDHMIVYDYVSGNWEQLGTFIVPPVDKYPNELSLSGDGGTIAAGYGAPGVNYESNCVFVWNSTDWVQDGQLIDAEGPNNSFQFNLDINEDGSRWITGEMKYSSNVNSLGVAKVYDTFGGCQWEENSSLQVNGQSANDAIGEAMEYTRNGNFLITGTGKGDGTGSNAGEVRIFEKNGNTWSQRGGTLFGEAANDEFGSSVAISSNGKFVLVGAPKNDQGGVNAGKVRMYKWNGSYYSPFGSDVLGQANNDKTGKSVDISSNGLYFIVGSPLTDINGTNSGKVQVYKRNAVNHIPIGQAISGTSALDQLGNHICISNDGSRIALGIPYHDVAGYNAGQVKVYDYIVPSNSWTQVGSSINGTDATDYFGSSLSLSDDGNTLAIGAFGTDLQGLNTGQVRVFAYKGVDWFLKGNVINGSVAEEFFGVANDLSDSGNRLVVGSYNDMNGTSSGAVNIFDYENNDWVQNGIEILGEIAGDKFGKSVSINAEGTSIAIGAVGTDFNGNNSGSIHVFETCTSNTKSLSFETDEENPHETSITEEIINEDLMLYPNPVQNELQWKIKDEQIQKVQIFNMHGQVVLSKEVEQGTLNVEALVSGAYFITLTSDKEVFQKKFIKK